MKRPSRFKVAAYMWAETFFTILAELCTRLAWKCAICPDCGANRYDGPPCKNVDDAS